MGQPKVRKISDNVIWIVVESGLPQRKIQLRRNGNTSTKGIWEWRFWAKNVANNCGMRVGAREWKLPGGDVKTWGVRSKESAKVWDWSVTVESGGEVTSQSDEGGSGQVGHEAMLWSRSLQYAQMCSTPCRLLVLAVEWVLLLLAAGGFTGRRFVSVILKRSISLKSSPQLASLALMQSKTAVWKDRMVS